MTHPPTWYQIGYHCLQSEPEAIAGRVNQVLFEAEMVGGKDSCSCGAPHKGLDKYWNGNVR